MAESLVLDASAMVDLLVGSRLAQPVEEALAGAELHVPAHFDAEVLSALGRLHRGEQLSARQVTERVELTASSPAIRHPLQPLLKGAWRRRENLRLVDALYVELASDLDALIISTDHGLAAVSRRVRMVTPQRDE